MKRIGVFSGTFDPIHKGHIAFALESANAAKLSKVYFLPEAKPRRKVGVTHYAHRVAMIRLATKLFQKLDVLELSDTQFSVNKTLPKLQKLFPDSELHLLIGSDAVPFFTDTEHWPNAKDMLKSFKLIVGLRASDQEPDIHKQLLKIDPSAKRFLIIDSPARFASSGDIRSALSRKNKHEAHLGSLKKYIDKNWLYESVRGSGTRS